MAAAAAVSLVCGSFAELILTRVCWFPAGSGNNRCSAAPDICTDLLGWTGEGAEAGGPRGQEPLTSGGWGGGRAVQEQLMFRNI